jgi:hypothetical protein
MSIVTAIAVYREEQPKRPHTKSSKKVIIAGNNTIIFLVRKEILMGDRAFSNVHDLHFS